MCNDADGINKWIWKKLRQINYGMMVGKYYHRRLFVTE